MTKSTKPKSPVNKAIDTAVKGLRGFVEVFRAGTHTDSKGRSVTFSKADVEQMVDNHKLGAAPAVIGHPKDTAPAYAQVAEYKLEDDGRLFAKFDKINPAFEAGVESGAYYNRSVSVVKDKVNGWRVRHVGWLGAMPPAIDGLAPLEYSAAADDETCFEFSAPGYSLVWGLESAAKLLRSLRDHLIEKETLAVADAVLPQWQIDSMTESATTARAQFNEDKSLFNQPTEDQTMITQEVHDAAVAQARAEGEAAGKQGTVPEAQFNAAQAELLTIKKAAQKTRIADQIKVWKEKGIILPRDEAGLSEYMASLEDEGKEFAFSSAEGEQKKSASAFFADFMAARGPVVKIGKKEADQGDALDVNDTQAVSQAASDFMVAEEGKGRHVTAAAAVQHVVAVAKGEK